MEIRKAALKDIEGIKALLKTYHIDSIREEDKEDGFVTTNITDEQLERLILKEEGVLIAVEENHVMAFAFAASWEFWSEWPFFAYMIEKLPDYSFQGQQLSTKNSYQYGPVCIHTSVRGTGLFENVFYASLSSMKKYPIMATFINQINHRSTAAHTKKVPMEIIGTFQYNGNDYYTLACSTDLSQIEE